MKNDVLSTAIDKQGPKKVHLLSKITINVWFLNLDGMSLPRLTRLERTFQEDETVHLLGICEIGTKYFNILTQRGWITSLKPTSKAEGIAYLAKDNIKNLIRENFSICNRTSSIKEKATTYSERQREAKLTNQVQDQAKTTT